LSKEIEKQIKKFSSASVEMTIIEEGINDDSGSSSYAAKVEASIICPICQKKTKAHKLEYGKQGKMRWVISNFERHLKSHFSNAGNPHGTEKTSKKTKQVSLENFLLSSSENQFEDESNEFEEHQNSEDEHDVKIAKRPKYSAMDSANCNISSSQITEINSGE